MLSWRALPAERGAKRRLGIGVGVSQYHFGRNRGSDSRNAPHNCSVVIFYVSRGRGCWIIGPGRRRCIGSCDSFGHCWGWRCGLCCGNS